MNNCNNDLAVKYINGRGSMPAENMQVARIYNMDAQQYSASANVLIQENCFAFQFTNLGDVKATVNGMVIFPSATPTTALGDSRSVIGHVLDLYKGNITLAFDPLSAGTNPLVEIVQLYYAKAY